MTNVRGAKGGSFLFFIGALMGIVMTYPAHAQNQTSCPDTITNRLELLQGEWAFNTAGTGLPFSQRKQGSGQARRLYGNSPDNPAGSGLKQGVGQPVASAGSFLASMRNDANGVPVGALTITTTTSRNGEIVQETGTGTYQAFSDCSGGTLTFNLESGPVSYNFYFGASGDISLVGIDIGDTIWGSGSRGGAPAGASCVCPCKILVCDNNGKCQIVTC
jgi:hypothetical protein